jgi:thiaminase/transcriptional activator TenA
MLRFSDELRQRADSIWSAQHTHPFVLGIGDGSLDAERFGFWLRQDYLFLIDYARLFATAVVRAPDLGSMTTFSTLLREVLGREMELHRSYCAEFGISAGELELTVKLPTTQGYTDFLVRTATTGDYPELLGALLPCMWGYSEVGIALGGRALPNDNRYRRWINVYADPEFEELAHWCRDLTDMACEGLPRKHLDRVAKVFITSSRYELAFWEMAWTKETWLV